MGSGATILIQSNVFKDDFCAIYILRAITTRQRRLVREQILLIRHLTVGDKQCGRDCGGRSEGVATIGNAAVAESVYHNLPSGQAIYLCDGGFIRDAEGDAADGDRHLYQLIGGSERDAVG